jgi:tetratricopeptide (TPR) repeat protein
MRIVAAAVAIVFAVPFQAPGAKFDPADPLKPAAIEFFLTRLAEGKRLAAAPAPAVAAVRAGQFDKALPSLAAAKQDGLATVFLTGISLYATGKLEEAAARFREAIRLDSEFFPAMFYLGACYAAGGRDDQAIGAWQTSLVSESAAPFIYTMIADAMLRLRQPEDAVDILDEAAAQWPNDEDVQARRASALAQAGKEADALRAVEALLEKAPAHHQHLMLAMRIIYEARSNSRAISTPEEDRARFRKYAAAYAAAGGPDQATVDQWRLVIER